MSELVKDVSGVSPPIHTHFLSSNGVVKINKDFNVSGKTRNMKPKVMSTNTEDILDFLIETNEKLVQDTKNAELEIRQGKGKKFKTKKDLLDYLESL